MCGLFLLSIFYCKIKLLMLLLSTIQTDSLIILLYLQIRAVRSRESPVLCRLVNFLMFLQIGLCTMQCNYNAMQKIILHVKFQFLRNTEETSKFLVRHIFSTLLILEGNYSTSKLYKCKIKEKCIQTEDMLEDFIVSC